MDSIARELSVTSAMRYAPSQSETFCNVFAYDVCCLAGAYLPRVWWTDQAIEKLTHGVAVGVRVDDTVTELNSNSLARWFSEFGASFGWRLLEGIPFAFRELPLAFEALREGIAQRLDVRTEDVSLVGSGRIGFSLAQYKSLQDYRPGVSDLDVLIISEELFRALVEEYESGMALWRSGEVSVSEKRQRYLVENEETTRRHRIRGFFDSNKVPVFRGVYAPPTTSRLERSVQFAIRTLGQRYMGGALIPPKLVRVYRCRDAAIRQNILSVESLVSRLVGTVRA